jgi:5-deoxy-glucuronate isomerase
MQYNASNLLVRPGTSEDPSVIVEVQPEKAGWEFINFQVRRLAAGASWSHETGENELAVVVLGGIVSVESPHANWRDIGGRANVFEGPPHACYLPRRTAFTVMAGTDCEFGVAWVATDEDHPARLITPTDVPVEIRGGDNATRQINGIIPPGFDCHRLVVVEVYTPSGGWSSYPPHKHDVHRTDEVGNLIEADLEETYYYKINRPDGFAYQRIYTDEASPLQQAGCPIDAVLIARDNDVVLVPGGYHPVVSAPGYTTYYLNVLAGSAQSLAAVDDPRHSWVKETYTTKNPAVPMYMY